MAPYDGSDVYSLPANTEAVSGAAVGSAKFNSLTGDIEDALNDLRIANLDVSADILSFLGAADDAAARTALGLAIGTNVQAFDAELAAIAALAVTDGNIIVGNGSTWVAESGATARTSLGLGTGDSPQFTAVNIGAATDTTITRVSAGLIAVEGGNVPLENRANTFSVTQTFTDYPVISNTGSLSLTLQIKGTNATSGPRVDLFHEGGSQADNDVLADLRFYGQDDGNNTTLYATVRGVAVDVTDATEDGMLAFRTVIGGSETNRAFVGAGLYVGNATGGDLGGGTVNATAVYDDNSLLTCYIGDVVDTTTGDEITVDTAALIAKWDAVVPDRVLPAEYVEQPVLDQDGNPVLDEKGRPVTEAIEVIPERPEPRQHFGARKFLARLGTEYDPRDIAKAMKHFKDKGHLTNMPNPVGFNPKSMSTGDWIQRLIEQAELCMVWVWKERRARLNFQQQAQQTIAALEARIAALEAAP